MRYRELTEEGDYLLGRAGTFLVDSPETVAQAVLTRLRLWSGEWFLDTSEGTPYETQILGYGTQSTRDLAIRERVLNTPGVDSITAYTSNVENRKMTVTMTVLTIYGPTTITTQV
jgi:hypothetical protein